MGYWWFWGYKTFTGPRPNIRGLRARTETDIEVETKGNLDE